MESDCVCANCVRGGARTITQNSATGASRKIDRIPGVFIRWSNFRSLTPLVYPQVFAPEAQQKLAGGGAQRNHRKRSNRSTRALEGRRSKIGSAAHPGPASLSGRKIGFVQLRWLRCAPPPANLLASLRDANASLDMWVNQRLTLPLPLRRMRAFTDRACVLFRAHSLAP